MTFWLYILNKRDAKEFTSGPYSRLIIKKYGREDLLPAQVDQIIQRKKYVGMHVPILEHRHDAFMAGIGAVATNAARLQEDALHPSLSVHPGLLVRCDLVVVPCVRTLAPTFTFSFARGWPSRHRV